MDPITAVVSALVASAGKKALDDSYERLKALFRIKFGSDSDVVQAIDQLEAKPDSTGRRQTLKEEIVAAKAHEDPDILQAIRAFEERTDDHLEEGQQIVVGNNIAQAAPGGLASVHIGTRGTASGHGISGRVLASAIGGAAVGNVIASVAGGVLFPGIGALIGPVLGAIIGGTIAHKCQDIGYPSLTLKSVRTSVTRPLDY